MKLGPFDKHFIKKSRKKAPPGKVLEFFVLDTLKTTFNLRMDTIRALSFDFQKRSGEASPRPPPSCAHVPVFWLIFQNSGILIFFSRHHLQIE